MSRLQPDTSTPTGRILARTSLLLLALLFLAGGTLAIWLLALEPLADAWRSRHWPAVYARIEEVSLGSPGTAQGPQIQVRYRYRYAGRNYDGNRYGLHQWMDSADAQEAAYGELLYAQRAWLWVNPKDPAEAVLNRDLHWTVIATALPALGTLILGALIVWAALQGARDTWLATRQLRQKRPPEPPV